MSEFRENRDTRPSSPPPERPKKQNPHHPYTVFLHKYRHLDDEGVIENFNTRELVYYFREVSQDVGCHYVIANIQKDMAIMKRLRESFSNLDICAMIEFLYHSEQDYLDKAHLSINVLGSQWINTIFADTQLWIDDQYVPKSKAKDSKRKQSQHEWSTNTPNSTQIGVKL